MPQTQCSTSAASLSDTLMHPLAYGAQTFFLGEGQPNAEHHIWQSEILTRGGFLEWNASVVCLGGKQENEPSWQRGGKFAVQRHLVTDDILSIQWSADLDLESPGVDLQCQADSNHRKIQEFEISGVLYWCLVSTVTRNSCPISRQPCNFVNSRDPARIVHMTEVGAHNLCKQFLPDPGVNGPARFKHLTQHKYDIDALTELSRSLSLQAQGKSRLELYRWNPSDTGITW